MEETKKVKKVLGSEALGILLGRWRDGTFTEILTDWKWILTYTRRYRRAVWSYTIQAPFRHTCVTTAKIC